MIDFIQDVRYGLRAIRKSPGFAAALLLTLILGIGANTAIFSVMNAVLLRPLPYTEPQRLVIVTTQFLRAGIKDNFFSVAEFEDLVRQNRTLDKVATYETVDVNLTGGAEPERIPAAQVTADFFPLLGVQAEAGRAFLSEDAQSDREIVVLSHGLWQRRFASDPGMVGRTVSLDGKPNVIAGIMPSGFRFPEEVGLWKLYAIKPQQAQSRGSRHLGVLARLKAGVSIAQARADAAAIAQRLLTAYPDSYPADSGWGIAVASMQEQQIGDFRTTLFVWLGAVGLVLLVACTNMVNLLLAKSLTRRRELALRAALGAKRSRLVRQFVTETLVLAMIGGGVGLLLAPWGLKLLLGIYPQAVPRSAEIGLDGRVLVFNLGLSLVIGLVLGLAPALQLARVDLTQPLKEGGKSTAGGGRFGARNLLVVGEVAFALVLLVGALLLIRSLMLLQEVKPGFNPDHVLTAQITLPASKYPKPYQSTAFYQQLLERLAQVPGIKSAGAISNLPFSNTNRTNSIFVQGHRYDAKAIPPESGIRRVTAGYFKTLGIPLIAGRSLAASDQEAAPPVAVIDQSVAKTSWPNEDPVGKRLSLEGPEGPWVTVVGVVGDVKHESLDSAAKMQIYFPQAQFPTRSLFVVLRTQREPETVVPALRSQVLALDPDQPIADVARMEDRLDRSLSRRRFSMWLLVTFAGVAVALAAIGIYGVVAFFVAQRTREIGIRMALGARRETVLGMTLRHGVTLALSGVACGLAAGLLLTRWMSSLLYGVAAFDYRTFALVAVLLLFIAGLASYLPARRAARVNPIEALKSE